MEQARHYELVYIVRTDVGDDVVTKLRERVDGIVETHKGKVVKFENWGKRKLAYEIDKNPKGVYHYYQFYSDNACVAEIQRNLKIHDAVLKYMSVLLDPDADPEKLAAAAAAAPSKPMIQDSETDLELPRDRDRDRPRRRDEDEDDLDDDEADDL